MNLNNELRKPLHGRNLELTKWREDHKISTLNTSKSIKWGLNLQILINSL